MESASSGGERPSLFRFRLEICDIISLSFQLRLKVEYKTHDGKKKKSKLLTSGFWGLARHLNYVFELLLALSWRCWDKLSETLLHQPFSASRPLVTGCSPLHTSGSSWSFSSTGLPGNKSTNEKLTDPGFSEMKRNALASTDLAGRHTANKFPTGWYLAYSKPEYLLILWNKVNKCLARYSPRATTTNQPTNRAPN